MGSNNSGVILLRANHLSSINGASYSVMAARIVLMNPIAQVIQDVRYNLITDTTITTWNYEGSWWSKLIPVFIVVIVTIIGAIYFRKKCKYFAEEV